MEEIIDKEIESRIAERSRLFDMLMDNELPKVGHVIIQSMNEHMAVILALKKIKLLIIPSVSKSFVCNDCKIPFEYDWQLEYNTCPKCGNDQAN